MSVTDCPPRLSCSQRFTTVPSCHIYVIIYSLRFVKTGDPIFRYFPHVLAICNVSVILILSLIFSSYLIFLIIYSSLLCDKAFRPFPFFAFLFSLSSNILGHVKIQGAVNRRSVSLGNQLRSQAVRVAYLVEELAVGQVYLTSPSVFLCQCYSKSASLPRFIHVVWSCVNFAVASLIKASKTADMNIFIQIQQGLLLEGP